ncbi:CU044_2847 family protein [Streptomyces sp. NPDC051286]|uniref:CU044_2847 family protein n=1 Tax=Streptomyces sp. NPDC051286 TaxID=3365647 RepID=UPI0037AA1417
MRSFARLPLENGGSILFEAVPEVSDGPVKAGRMADAIHDLPSSLQSALIPVRGTARAEVDQLRQAGPEELEIEFGVDLAAQAGAVITQTEANCHLKVRALWRKAEDGQAGAAGS